jgi:hypothetical protein
MEYFSHFLVIFRTVAADMTCFRDDAATFFVEIADIPRG